MRVTWPRHGLLRSQNGVGFTVVSTASALSLKQLPQIPPDDEATSHLRGWSGELEGHIPGRVLDAPPAVLQLHTCHHTSVVGWRVNFLTTERAHFRAVDRGLALVCACALRRALDAELPRNVKELNVLA